MKKELKGWISEYNVQGMESEFWRVFQDKEFAENENSGWQMEGMYILQEGDELDIFDIENKLLWSGKIQTRRKGFLGLIKLCSHRSNLSSGNIELEIWEKWFRHDPPLKAVLRREI